MINFKHIGKLTQAAEELPFIPKRIYWIHTEGEARGGHAHIKTEQVFTCAQGSYIFVVDNGVEVKRYGLAADKHFGIFISNEWHTMENCSEDCIILVFANMLCDERDYIRDKDKWKEWIHGAKNL